MKIQVLWLLMILLTGCGSTQNNNSNKNVRKAYDSVRSNIELPREKKWYIWDSCNYYYGRSHIKDIRTKGDKLFVDITNGPYTSNFEGEFDPFTGYIEIDITGNEIDWKGVYLPTSKTIFLIRKASFFRSGITGEDLSWCSMYMSTERRSFTSIIKDSKNAEDINQFSKTFSIQHEKSWLENMALRVGSLSEVEYTQSWDKLDKLLAFIDRMELAERESYKGVNEAVKNKQSVLAFSILRETLNSGGEKRQNSLAHLMYITEIEQHKPKLYEHLYASQRAELNDYTKLLVQAHGTQAIQAHLQYLQRLKNTAQIIEFEATYKGIINLLSTDTKNWIREQQQAYFYELLSKNLNLLLASTPLTIIEFNELDGFDKRFANMLSFLTPKQHGEINNAIKKHMNSYLANSEEVGVNNTNQPTGLTTKWIHTETGEMHSIRYYIRSKNEIASMPSGSSTIERGQYAIEVPAYNAGELLFENDRVRIYRQAICGTNLIFPRSKDCEALVAVLNIRGDEDVTRKVLWEDVYENVSPMFSTALLGRDSTHVYIHAVGLSLLHSRQIRMMSEDPIFVPAKSYQRRIPHEPIERCNIEQTQYSPFDQPQCNFHFDQDFLNVMAPLAFIKVYSNEKVMEEKLKNAMDSWLMQIQRRELKIQNSGWPKKRWNRDAMEAARQKMITEADIVYGSYEYFYPDDTGYKYMRTLSYANIAHSNRLSGDMQGDWLAVALWASLKNGSDIAFEINQLESRDRKQGRLKPLNVLASSIEARQNEWDYYAANLEKFRNRKAFQSLLVEAYQISMEKLSTATPAEIISAAMEGLKNTNHCLNTTPTVLAVYNKTWC